MHPLRLFPEREYKGEASQNCPCLLFKRGILELDIHNHSVRRMIVNGHVSAYNTGPREFIANCGGRFSPLQLRLEYFANSRQRHPIYDPDFFWQRGPFADLATHELNQILFGSEAP